RTLILFLIAMIALVGGMFGAGELTPRLFTVEQNVAAFHGIYLELISHAPVRRQAETVDAHGEPLPFANPAEAYVPGHWTAGRAGGVPASAPAPGPGPVPMVPPVSMPRPVTVPVPLAMSSTARPRVSRSTEAVAVGAGPALGESDV
ncbi:hypothetical protein AB0R12_13860, partial [Streptomyces niveus]